MLKDLGVILMKIKISELCFWCAFVIYIVYWMIFYSCYYYLLNNVNMIENVFRLIVIALVSCSILFKNRWNITDIWKIVIIVFSTLVTYIFTGYANLVVIAFLIVGAQGVKDKDIIKINAYVVTLMTIFIVISANLGIIRNDIYLRTLTGDDSYIKAQGFLGYGSISYIVFMLNLSYVYVKKKLKYTNIIIMLVIDVIVWQIFSNRLTLGLEIFFLLLLLVSRRWNLKSWISGKITILIPTICMLISVLATMSYSPNNVILSKINDALSWRLYYGKIGIEKYMVSLFGQQISMRGNLAVGQTSQEAYYYIDCGYVYSLLAYGVLMTVLVLIMYTIMLHCTRLKNNRVLFCILVVMMTANCINNFWLNCVLNPFMLFFFSVLKERKIIQGDV